jgi:hypothetical protein
VSMSVLSTDLYFQVRQARRRYTRLLTGALVNQLILRLIKCPDYPQSPKRRTPATMQFTRMTLIRPSCSSHRLEVGYSDTHLLVLSCRGSPGFPAMSSVPPKPTSAASVCIVPLVGSSRIGHPSVSVLANFPHVCRSHID